MLFLRCYSNKTPSFLLSYRLKVILFMASPKDSRAVHSAATIDGGADGSLLRRSVAVQLPLGDAAATFNLEKAVCSHGLFMTAPNHWDPLSRTLRRPLRLLHSDDDDGSVSSSVTVQISQPSQSHLLLRVFDTEALSLPHRQSLTEQVRRMLRLSDEEERNLREFQEMYAEAKATGSGRMFRSPTLFEDMVKCILLCNCQWSRTLTMARALCELQLELQRPTSNVIATKYDDFSNPAMKTEQFSPKTPAEKEARKKIKVQGKARKLAQRSAEIKAAIEAEAALRVDCAEASDSLQGKLKRHRSIVLANNEEEFIQKRDSCETSNEINEENLSGVDVETLAKTEMLSYGDIGNFPSPKELANLDVNLLAKRCGLGYRAGRILDLARGVVEGTIQLKQLEEDCGQASLSNYNKLFEQLRKIKGFGPFTCANVLMFMGFYHVIPSDSETLRHLKQVHKRESTIQNVQQHLDLIYGKYAPFQFLVYWSEVWSFYEEKFGKLSELPDTQYKRITAANMRSKNDTNKRTK